MWDFTARFLMVRNGFCKSTEPEKSLICKLSGCNKRIVIACPLGFGDLASKQELWVWGVSVGATKEVIVSLERLKSLRPLPLCYLFCPDYVFR